MPKRKKPKDDLPTIGHNSALTDDNRRKLAGFVSELENLWSEMDDLRKDEKEIFAAAKDANFDTKALRAVLKERRIDKAKRVAFEVVLDAYRHALGMLADTPLGQAAIARLHPPKAPAPRTDVSDVPFHPPATA